MKRKEKEALVESIRSELEGREAVNQALDALVTDTASIFLKGKVIPEQVGLMVNAVELAYSNPEESMKEVRAHVKAMKGRPNEVFMEEMRGILAAGFKYPMFSAKFAAKQAMADRRWKKALADFRSVILGVCKNGALDLGAGGMDARGGGPNYFNPKEFECWLRHWTRPEAIHEPREEFLRETIRALLAA